MFMPVECLPKSKSEFVEMYTANEYRLLKNKESYLSIKWELVTVCYKNTFLNTDNFSSTLNYLLVFLLYKTFMYSFINKLVYAILLSS